MRQREIDRPPLYRYLGLNGMLPSLCKLGCYVGSVGDIKKRSMSQSKDLAIMLVVNIGLLFRKLRRRRLANIGSVGVEYEAMVPLARSALVGGRTFLLAPETERRNQQAPALGESWAAKQDNSSSAGASGSGNPCFASSAYGRFTCCRCARICMTRVFVEISVATSVGPWPEGTTLIREGSRCSGLASAVSNVYQPVSVQRVETTTQYGFTGSRSQRDP